LVIAGDGPCRRALEEQARSLGISAQVEVLGMQTNIPEILNGFDIFTLSSTTEGTSMTILEAMACGVPVVATDVGGNREIIDPPNCGLTVPAVNSAALASAYLELLRDPDRRRQMGISGRQRILEHFSLQAMAKQYADLYDQLCQRKHVR
jgi:glycosyltransferase involved in cell wall biosynthesis